VIIGYRTVDKQNSRLVFLVVPCATREETITSGKNTRGSASPLLPVQVDVCVRGRRWRGDGDGECDISVRCVKSSVKKA